MVRTCGPKASPRRFVIVLIPTALVLLLASCTNPISDPSGDTAAAASPDGSGPGSEGTTLSDGRLVVGVEDASFQLNPLLETQKKPGIYNRNVYETLVFHDHNYEPIPMLAAELPTQVDATTWQVEIREGVTFHNGDALDADDVVDTFDRIVNDEELRAESGSTQRWSAFSGAKRVDEFTINIELIEPDPGVLSRLEHVPILPEGSAELDLSSTSVGTGPYRLMSRQGEQGYTLEPNPDYWGEPGAFQQVEVRFIPDDGARTSALLAGEVDLISSSSQESLGQVPKAIASPEVQVNMLNLNADAGITSDPAVRRALDLAIDKESLLTFYREGEAEVISQLISPRWFGHDEEIEPRPYDPEAARALLEEAGAVGEEIMLVGREDWGSDAVQVIQSNWEDVGLEVNLQVLGRDQFLEILFAENVDDRADAIYLRGANETRDAHRMMELYHSADSGRAVWQQDGQLSELVQQAGAASEQDARLEMYRRALERVHEQTYMVPLIQTPTTWYFMQENVHWEPRDDAYILLEDVRLASS